MVGAGADWPNWFTPREMPLNPTYFNQPNVEAASTDTRASTSGGRTESCKTQLCLTIHVYIIQVLKCNMQTKRSYGLPRQEGPLCDRCMSTRRLVQAARLHNIVTLYCWSCSSNSSQETMETTRHFLPSFSTSLAASTASPSSVPVPFHQDYQE